MKPHIDPEFRALIPPLTVDEYQQLEANLIADGCRDPLVVWEGIVLDGHHRLEICEARDIPYTMLHQPCTNRDAAMEWIIRNQFGRRNLPDFVKAELIEKLRPLLATQAHARMVHDPDQPAGQAPPAPRTDRELGRLAGVSHDTIHKSRVITAHGTEEEKAALRSKKRTLKSVYEKVNRRRKGEPEPMPPNKRTGIEAREEDVARLRTLAAEGWATRQVAKALKRSEDWCRKMLKVHHIPCPGDVALNGKRRMKPNDMMDRLSFQAEHLMADVDLITLQELDPARLPGWITSLKIARRSIDGFIRTLTAAKDRTHAKDTEQSEDTSRAGNEVTH